MRSLLFWATWLQACAVGAHTLTPHAGLVPARVHAPRIAVHASNRRACCCPLPDAARCPRVFSKMVQSLADLGYDNNLLVRTQPPCGCIDRDAARACVCRCCMRCRCAGLTHGAPCSGCPLGVLEARDRLTSSALTVRRLKNARLVQIAVPYDWRLPLGVMEARDGFFSRVKAEAELQARLYGVKPVLVSHSYGAVVTVTFLDWVERMVGSGSCGAAVTGCLVA